MDLVIRRRGESAARKGDVAALKGSGRVANFFGAVSETGAGEAVEGKSR